MLVATPIIAAPAHLRSKILQAAGGTSPATPPQNTPQAVSPLRRWLDNFFRPSLQLRPALVFAVVALFVITNVFWLVRLQQQETPAIEDRLMNYIGTGEGATTQVNFQAQADAPEASLVYSRSELQDSWVGLFSVRNLPELAAGQTYQGWLMRGNEDPLSIGVFKVEDGTGILIFEIGESIGEFEQVGITAEPDGGSPGPTSDPVLAGQL
jgi:anti-sigma-K factor RskA